MVRRAPSATTRRLSLYLRVLGVLHDAEQDTVSSSELAETCGLNPSQVRKDLAHYGGFGKRGVGYRVETLRDAIAAILGVDRTRRVVIVGAGNLGTALGNYQGFDGEGFEIVALFDVSDDRVGTITRTGRPVLHIGELERVVAEHEVSVGIVAVPAPAAQQVVDRLAEVGVRAILNFAPTRPAVPGGVAIQSVDLKVELESLSSLLAEMDESDGPREHAEPGGGGAMRRAGRRRKR